MTLTVKIAAFVDGETVQPGRPLLACGWESAAAILCSVDGHNTFPGKVANDVPGCTASHSRTAVIFRTYQIYDRLSVDLPHCRLQSM
jgi:hypothetical protein